MTSPKETITDGKVVFLHYVLTDVDGDIIDESTPDDPLAYIHGTGTLIPGMEEALAGRSVGEQFKVVIPPERGYGVRTTEGPKPVPRSAFPEGFEIVPGMQLDSEDEDGTETAIWIVDVEDDIVYIDTDHPLAGVTLQFDVSILTVRDATREELAHGHVHGAGGAHH